MYIKWLHRDVNVDVDVGGVSDFDVDVADVA